MVGTRESLHYYWYPASDPDYFTVLISAMWGYLTYFLCRICLTLPIGWWCLWLSLCTRVLLPSGWHQLTMIVFMMLYSGSFWLGAYLKRRLLAWPGLKLPQAISGPFNPSQGTYIEPLASLGFGLE